MASILKEMAPMRLQYEGVLFMFGSVSGFLLELVSSDFPLPPRWPQAGSQEFEKIVACVLELGGQTCRRLGGVQVFVSMVPNTLRKHLLAIASASLYGGPDDD